MAKKVENAVVDIGAIVRERRHRNESAAEERRLERGRQAAERLEALASDRERRRTEAKRRVVSNRSR